MNKLHQAEARVKEVTLDEGFLHIDLSDGLRLTGPLRRAGAGDNQPRLVDTGPGGDWDPGHHLDGLLDDPA